MEELKKSKSQRGERGDVEGAADDKERLFPPAIVDDKRESRIF